MHQTTQTNSVTSYHQMLSISIDKEVLALNSAIFRRAMACRSFSENTNERTDSCLLIIIILFSQIYDDIISLS